MYKNLSSGPVGLQTVNLFNFLSSVKSPKTYKYGSTALLSTRPDEKVKRSE